jgi:hypothetical protein
VVVPHRAGGAGLVAVRAAQPVRVVLPGRLLPGEVVSADMDALMSAERCASLSRVPVAVWLAQGPPPDAPGLWRLRSVRGFVQGRLRDAPPAPG